MFAAEILLFSPLLLLKLTDSSPFLGEIPQMCGKIGTRHWIRSRHWDQFRNWVQMEPQRCCAGHADEERGEELEHGTSGPLVILG